MNEYSFEKGWSLLNDGQKEEARPLIMAVFNIKNKVSFWRRKRGDVEPTKAEYEKVTEIFRSYGIAIKNIWGE